MGWADVASTKVVADLVVQNFACDGIRRRLVIGGVFSLHSSHIQLWQHRSPELGCTEQCVCLTSFMPVSVDFLSAPSVGFMPVSVDFLSAPSMGFNLLP